MVSGPPRMSDLHVTPEVLAMAYQMQFPSYLEDAWRGMQEVPAIDALAVLDVREIIAFSQYSHRVRSGANGEEIQAQTTLPDLFTFCFRGRDRPPISVSEKRLRKYPELYAEWVVANPHSMKSQGSTRLISRLSSLKPTLQHAIMHAAGKPAKQYCSMDELMFWQSIPKYAERANNSALLPAPREPVTVE